MKFVMRIYVTILLYQHNDDFLDKIQKFWILSRGGGVGHKQDIHKCNIFLSGTQNILCFEDKTSLPLRPRTAGSYSCKTFSVSNVYTRYHPDVRERGEGVSYKTNRQGGVQKVRFCRTSWWMIPYRKLKKHYLHTEIQIIQCILKWYKSNVSKRLFIHKQNLVNNKFSYPSVLPEKKLTRISIK